MSGALRQSNSPRVDSGSGTTRLKLVSVTSNEPDNGLGDRDTPNDIPGWNVGTADTSGQLRAERSGKGTGRQYTLTYAADDLAGNRSTCTTAVIVPMTEGNKSPYFWCNGLLESGKRWAVSLLF